MNETKILAAILTIAASAREQRARAIEAGKEHWHKVIEDYERILATLQEKR